MGINTRDFEETYFRGIKCASRFAAHIVPKEVSMDSKSVPEDRSPNESRILSHADKLKISTFVAEFQVALQEEAEEGIIDVDALSMEGVPKHMRDRFMRKQAESLASRAAKMGKR